MIAIIDYGMGNVGSIANMLRKIGAEACIARDPETIANADKLVLPGVGAFDSGMEKLDSSGLLPVLRERVQGAKVPILGLCLGMQFFGTGSEEGSRPGLGWIDARSVRFAFDGPQAGLKIPHMGWNHVSVEQPGPLFANMPVDSRFYFVHSYHVVCSDPGLVLTTTTYGYPFVSGVVKGHITGFQFHPEKSHRFGMQVFRNFAAMSV